jgi:hypothetical protein
MVHFTAHSKDATYVISTESPPSASPQPQSDIRFVWERLVGHFVKLVRGERLRRTALRSYFRRPIARSCGICARPAPTA